MQRSVFLLVILLILGCSSKVEKDPDLVYLSDLIARNETIDKSTEICKRASVLYVKWGQQRNSQEVLLYGTVDSIGTSYLMATIKGAAVETIKDFEFFPAGYVLTYKDHAINLKEKKSIISDKVSGWFLCNLSSIIEFDENEIKSIQRELLWKRVKNKL